MTVLLSFATAAPTVIALTALTMRSVRVVIVVEERWGHVEHGDGWRRA